MATINAGQVGAEAVQPDDAYLSAKRPAYAWYVVVVLMLVYLFNYMDRQLPFILAQAIKEDLHLSDTEIGLLAGALFAIFSVVAGIPLARLSDRWSHPLVLGLCVAFWSGMTALGGAARGFWSLAFTRVGVAVGEGGCIPPAHALIASYFPISKRAFAMSIFSLGAPLGIMTGLFAGGILNDLGDWRMAFVSLGLPGLVLGLLVMFTVREVPEAKQIRADHQTIPLGKLALILVKKRSFVHATAGATLLAFGGVALMAFLPAYLIRAYGFTTTIVGANYGLAVGFIGLIGLPLGGIFADRMARTDKRWALWVPAIGMAVNVPLVVTALLIGNGYATMWLVALSKLGSGIYLGPVAAAIQALAPRRSGASAAAVMSLCTGILGSAMGPVCVGFVSDLLEPAYGTTVGLGLALFLVPLSFGWAALHFWLGSRSLREDLAASARERGEIA